MTEGNEAALKWLRSVAEFYSQEIASITEVVREINERVPSPTMKAEINFEADILLEQVTRSMKETQARIKIREKLA